MHIIHFPNARVRQMVVPTPCPTPKNLPVKPALNAFDQVQRAVWMLVVFVWPVLKWVVSIAAFFKLCAMLIHWNTPGRHDGWVFLLYFGVLVALTHYVSAYRPKGVR